MSMACDDVLVATFPAATSQQRIALIAIVASIVLFLAIAPFAKIQLPAVPAFISVYQTALALSDLITAVLLFGQYRILHARALCVLGCGYLFTAFVTIIHALSFPGLFAPAGLLGAGPQTTAWLYMFWHGGFPLFVIAYAYLKDDREEPRRATTAIIAGVIGTVILTGAVALFSTTGQKILPAIMEGHRYTPLMIGVVSSVWLLSAAALYTLWQREQRSVLDLWLIVVMCAWLIDIALSAVLNGGRFDLGFYAGRLYGLLAASFLLFLLLLEHGAMYARLVATSIELRRLTSTDPLTGIANRRSFDEAIGQEWRRATRHRQPLSLLILDVDHFKRYNDAYGHVEGDRCLRTVANIVDATIKRAGDLAARYGGEEFAVILPHTALAEARALAQQICDAVHNGDLPHRDSPVAECVTVSIGVATCAPPTSPDQRHHGTLATDSIALIEAADQALYDAKAAGRNRIAWAMLEGQG
jgi:diguanylate cyclase (GGDEF)-like protein